MENRYGTIDFRVYINPTFLSNMYIFMPKANVAPCRYCLENYDTIRNIFTMMDLQRRPIGYFQYLLEYVLKVFTDK